MLHAQVDQLTKGIDTFAIHDLELSLFEWRGDFVFHHFNAGLTADHVIALFDCADTTDIKADRSVELQRVTTGSGFRVTEHHTNLHTNLVDEDQQRI